MLYECGPWANCPDGAACCQAASQQVTSNCGTKNGHGQRELITAGNCQTGNTATGTVINKSVNEGAHNMSEFCCVYVAVGQQSYYSFWLVMS